MTVKHYSDGITDMLCMETDGSLSPIYNKDIFHVLSENSSTAPSSSTQSFFSSKKSGMGVLPKGFKSVILERLKAGDAVSVEINLLTGIEMLMESDTLANGPGRELGKKVEERYVTHWTPLKDEIARTKWVVLTIAPRW